MKTTKIIALLLAVLMLGCMSGCGKSSELKLNGNILENSYFSIDVSGYTDIRVGEEETGDPFILAICIVPNETGSRNNYAYIAGGQKGTFPSKDYFEMVANNPQLPNAVSGEVIAYESYSDGSGFVELQYQMEDGSIGYDYRRTYVADNDISFGFNFFDLTGPDKDENFTNAIESLTWK